MNRLPSWFKQDLPNLAVLNNRLAMLGNLNTVCQSAHCPNMGSCFKNGQATFMILGDTCTRNCRFCAVKKGNPNAVNADEPSDLAKAAKEMCLDYVVITSVSRDDLEDKGAHQFVRCVEQLRVKNKNMEPCAFTGAALKLSACAKVSAGQPSQPIGDIRRSPEDSSGRRRIRIELLIPDFQGAKKSLEIVVKSQPDVIAHNLETIARLYKEVRPLADYKTSLRILEQVKQMDNSIITKSGIMVGLGEAFEEVVALMKDLRKVNCDILTIGQYLAPSEKHFAVQRFLREVEFEEFKNIGQALGFKCVFSAPLVRSSYQASKIFEKCMTS